MTNTEINDYLETIASYDINALVAAIYADGASDEMVTAFNSARFGSDVRTDITKLSLLLRALGWKIAGEYDTIKNAKYVTRQLTSSSNISDFTDATDPITTTVVWLKNASSADGIPAELAGIIGANDAAVLVNLYVDGEPGNAVQYLLPTENHRIYVRWYNGSAWGGFADISDSARFDAIEEAIAVPPRMDTNCLDFCEKVDVDDSDPTGHGINITWIDDKVSVDGTLNDNGDATTKLWGYADGKPGWLKTGAVYKVVLDPYGAGEYDHAEFLRLKATFRKAETQVAELNLVDGDSMTVPDYDTVYLRIAVDKSLYSEDDKHIRVTATAGLHTAPNFVDATINGKQITTSDIAITKEPLVYNSVFAPREDDGTKKFYYLADCDRDNTIFYCARNATLKIYYPDLPKYTNENGQETPDTPGYMIQIKAIASSTTRVQYFYGFNTGNLYTRKGGTSIDDVEWIQVNTRQSDFVPVRDSVSGLVSTAIRKELTAYAADTLAECEVDNVIYFCGGNGSGTSGNTTATDRPVLAQGYFLQIHMTGTSHYYCQFFLTERISDTTIGDETKKTADGRLFWRVCTSTNPKNYGFWTRLNTTGTEFDAVKETAQNAENLALSMHGRLIETAWYSREVYNAGSSQAPEYAVKETDKAKVSDFIPYDADDNVFAFFANQNIPKDSDKARGLQLGVVCYDFTGTAFPPENITMDAEREMADYIIGDIKSYSQPVSVNEKFQDDPEATESAYYYRIQVKKTRTPNEGSAVRIAVADDDIKKVFIAKEKNTPFSAIYAKSDSSDSSASDTKIYEAQNLEYTKNSTIVVQPTRQTRDNIIVTIDAMVTLTPGGKIAIRNAPIYDGYGEDAQIVATANATAPYVDYYLKNGITLDNDTVDETDDYTIDGIVFGDRVQISDSANGDAIGWIDRYRLTLPKFRISNARVNGRTPGYIASTSALYVGGIGEYKINQYRIVAHEKGVQMTLRFDVPEYCTLSIKSIRVAYDNTITRSSSGIQFDAHGSFLNFPQHTYPAVQIAAQCGADRCIVIPKRSSDGVWFAYHDDDFNSMTSIMRTHDGEKLMYEEDGQYHYHEGYEHCAAYESDPTVIDQSAKFHLLFRQIPFAGIKNIDFGSYKGSDFAGTGPMLISEYYELCVKTGMKPMFSMHPQYTATELASLRELTDRYGLTKRLTLKITSDGTPEKVAYFTNDVLQAFGNDIEEYILIANTEDQEKTEDEVVSAAISTFDAAKLLTGGKIRLDTAKVICAVEQWIQKATPALVNNVISNGYVASLAEHSHTGPDGKTHSALDSDDIEYWTRQGVREFMTNKNASFGLAW